MKKINFEAGIQVSPAKVIIDDVEHNVTPAVYEGNTPLSPFVLNTLQDNIEKEFQVDKTTITGKTSQEGTPSPTNIVPIKNVNVYGVNECNLGNETFTNIGFKNIINGSEWKISGTSTADNYIRTDFISLGKFKKGNYAFKIDSKITSSNIAFVLRNLTTNTSISSTAVQNKTINCTLEEETELGVNIWNNGTGNIINGIIYIKLEEGTTPTQYTPYGYGLLDLNLQKDTDTKTVTLISKRLHEDDSVDENGFHYNRKTIVLDGSETGWNAVEESSANEQVTTQKGIFCLFTTNNILLSSHFKNNNLTSITNNLTAYNNLEDGCFNVRKGTLDRVYFRNSNLSTVAELKTWLAEQYANGTPVTSEYKLATQENVLFNETNQTAWNTLEDLLLQGYTFINSSSDELQPTVTLTEHTANEIHRENVEKFKELEENIKETILYENTSGSNGDITLNDSIEHYKYLEVIYGRSSDRHYMKIISQKNYVINMSSFSSYLDNSNIMLEQYFAKYQILDETTLQVVLNRCGLVTLKNNTVSGNTNGTNYLKIYRVIGIK